MEVNALNFALLSDIIKKEKLLNEEELKIIADLTRNDFSFAAQLAIADIVHFHIHGPDIEKLAHELFTKSNGIIENKKEGYIKYGFPGGLKIIFSQYPCCTKRAVCQML